MKRHRQGLRFLGALFAFFGGSLVVGSVPLALDPEATIYANGALTSSIGTKLAFAFGAAWICELGVWMLRASPRSLDKLYIWRESLAQTLFRRTRP